jgi:hypothetical protein
MMNDELGMMNTVFERSGFAANIFEIGSSFA